MVLKKRIKERNYMQVLIDLHTSKEENLLHGLLSKLEGSGYQIHSLYGNFIFDIKKKEAIDVGEAGENVPSSLELCNAIYETGGKLALVFVEEKYVVFANSYFLAMNYCHNRTVRPLSMEKALKHFSSLFLEKSEESLQRLYEEQYQETFGLYMRPNKKDA